jgi:rare lipoprotein A
MNLWRENWKPFTALILGVVAIMAFFWYAVPVRAETCGIRATWYGLESCQNPHDCRTANGERYTAEELTAAHRTYRFGTKLRVTYRGKSVVVRVNDRGPARYTGNDLDLSKAAAQRIGMIRAGRVKLCMERLS